MFQTVPLAVLALLATSAAAAALEPIHAAPTTTAYPPWVTVADDGTRHTITPILTAIHGTTTLLSGAPRDLTATVFTSTRRGDKMTSTGRSPVATARNSDGSGSFLKCHKSDTLFCMPKSGANMYPKTNYYFTWDTAAFAPNASIMIEGNYFNATTNEPTSQAFVSDKVAASKGYWTLPVKKGLMQGWSARNISVRMLELDSKLAPTNKTRKGPYVLVTKRPAYRPPRAELPSGATLFIALPTVFSVVTLFVVGTYIWNKQLRKISLGNVMSRRKHRYVRGRRVFGRVFSRRRKEKHTEDAEERVRLLEWDGATEEAKPYYDVPADRDTRRKKD